MATSPEEGMASLFKNLEAKTGKSIDEWVKLANATEIGKHKELVAYLKTTHELSHGYAHQIALKALSASAGIDESPDSLIAAQFAGKKEAMRPLYDALTRTIFALGPEAAVSAKKSCVSYRRTKQFALVQVFAGRLDLCIQLKEHPGTARLEPTPGAMLSHRVKVSDTDEIDDELIGWLAEGYASA